MIKEQIGGVECDVFNVADNSGDLLRVVMPVDSATVYVEVYSLGQRATVSLRADGISALRYAVELADEALNAT